LGRQVGSATRETAPEFTTWLARVLDLLGTPLVIEPSAGQLPGDAGLLPVRQFDRRLGLTRAFADALDDHRDTDLTEHSLTEMVRARVFGIVAGCQDDHDNRLDC
jgi:hypothetical protein